MKPKNIQKSAIHITIFVGCHTFQFVKANPEEDKNKNQKRNLMKYRMGDRIKKENFGLCFVFCLYVLQIN